MAHGVPRHVALLTHTHTHILQIQICHKKIAPPAHTLYDTAAVANPVLRLVLFVALFFAAGPIHSNFYGMNSLT